MKEWGWSYSVPKVVYGRSKANSVSKTVYWQTHNKQCPTGCVQAYGQQCTEDSNWVFPLNLETERMFIFST